jgi:UDP-2,3-diacylglucosamine pyrophosphatase LpxH
VRLLSQEEDQFFRFVQKRTKNQELLLVGNWFEKSVFSGKIQHDNMLNVYIIFIIPRNWV